MGITIHYRGKLNDVGQLDNLCGELATIAKAMGWEIVKIDDDWTEPVSARFESTPDGVEIVGNLGLKGILLSPTENSESLKFFFDKDGNLRDIFTMISIADGTFNPEYACVSVKTQFASPELHIWIIGLLKYLKKKYITNLYVNDEGEYWETGDISILKKKIDFINKKIIQLSSDLSSCDLGDVSELTPEQIADKIEQLLFDNEGKDAE